MKKTQNKMNKTKNDEKKKIEIPRKGSPSCDLNNAKTFARESDLVFSSRFSASSTAASMRFTSFGSDARVPPPPPPPGPALRVDLQAPSTTTNPDTHKTYVRPIGRFFLSNAIWLTTS